MEEFVVVNNSGEAMAATESVIVFFLERRFDFVVSSTSSVVGGVEIFISEIGCFLERSLDFVLSTSIGGADIISATNVGSGSVATTPIDAFVLLAANNKTRHCVLD
jgi:hypothetical protein